MIARQCYSTYVKAKDSGFCACLGRKTGTPCSLSGLVASLRSSLTSIRTPLHLNDWGVAEYWGVRSALHVKSSVVTLIPHARCDFEITCGGADVLFHLVTYPGKE